MFKKKIALLLISILPTSSFAAGMDFRSFSQNIYENIFTLIVDLIFVASIVFFAWSVFRIVSAQGDKRDELKGKLFWGVLALFLMTSIWGILQIGGETFFKGDLGGDGQEFFDEFKYRNTYDPDFGESSSI